MLLLHGRPAATGLLNSPALSAREGSSGCCCESKCWKRRQIKFWRACRSQRTQRDAAAGAAGQLATSSVGLFLPWCLPGSDSAVLPATACTPAIICLPSLLPRGRTADEGRREGEVSPWGSCRISMINMHTAACSCGGTLEGNRVAGRVWPANTEDGGSRASRRLPLVTSRLSCSSIPLQFSAC